MNDTTITLLTLGVMNGTHLMKVYIKFCPYQGE
jgi:hypothetical protein